MAWAFLLYPVSSQGMFGKQKIGWYFSFKEKSQLSLPACGQPCKTLTDLHQDSNPMWANVAQCDHCYILTSANMSLAKTWPNFTLGPKPLGETELYAHHSWDLPKPGGASSRTPAGASGPALLWAYTAHQTLWDHGGKTFQCPICKTLLAVHKQCKEIHVGDETVPSAAPLQPLCMHPRSDVSNISHCTWNLHTTSAKREITEVIHTTNSCAFPNIKLVQFTQLFSVLDQNLLQT